MENTITIKSNSYDIPAIISYPDSGTQFPAVILCHGTASNKDEVGNLFVKLTESLRKQGVASLRFDFAGCGDSQAKQQDLTFFGEVTDTEKVYSYLCQDEKIDSTKIGILGFSQGARVMTEFLGKYPSEIKVAVSWSGACHNGAGVFEGWFNDYYEEAKRNSYARIPMGWRDDLLLSKAWFDEIYSSKPMDSFAKFEGAILAISGTKDALVPYQHAKEIVNACKGSIGEYKFVEHANHIFNVLDHDQSIAKQVIRETTDWIVAHINN